MDITQAIILAVVEGFTEFLPISSTGHMIIVSTLMGIQSDQFVKDYTVVVQFGAILSVLCIYWRRLLTTWSLQQKILIGFFPAAVLGFTFKRVLNEWLGSTLVVAWALIVGGILLILIDRILKLKSGVTSTDQISRKQALKIGIFQCLALIPGTSRAAASIVGAQVLGLDRRTATEFSFFLAIPTLMGATAVKMTDVVERISPDMIQILVVGNLVSFAVALLAVKGFIATISRTGFVGFGVYRIVVGTVLLTWLYLGRSI